MIEMLRILFHFFPAALLPAVVAASIAAAIYFRKRKPPLIKGLLFLFLVFIAVLYLLTACLILFKFNADIVNGAVSPFHGNYIPFKTISAMLHPWGGNTTVQLIGNILVTLPLPFVVWLFSKKRSVKAVCIASLVITALIEPIQLLINLILSSSSNIIDIDDLILNLLGCTTGLLLLKIMKRERQSG